MIRPLKEFPLMYRYKKVFPIDENTIFAYDGDIYTNNKLPNHLIVHEEEHLRQQEEIGLDKWVYQYLTDTDFRLKMEVFAYNAQLDSIKDRNKRFLIRVACANMLSSKLYGNLVSKEQAMKLLK